MASLTANKLWTDFQALSDDSREEFLERLVDHRPTREELEDILDLSLALDRSAEPTRSLDDVLNELGR